MKKTLLLVTILFVSSIVLAEEEATESQPLDPAYMGLHGMVLMNNGSDLFASHLPTYNKPHDAQIIYTIGVSDAALLYLIRDADMVTIKPKPFNLQRLVRGESFTVKADVYMGHFERGGMLTYESMDITFDEQLYLRMLDKPQNSHIRQTYDSVTLKNNQRILVHQIQKPPSYDHLILLYDNVNCVTQFGTSSAVPSQSELNSKISFCGSIKPLYYETKDFQ
ncbi:MAG: hypothetical protein ACI88A_003884 [Paraglaciecola sp.]|jgi:hypothetical protein